MADSTAAARNRRVIEKFYDLAFVQKRFIEASERYVGDRYVQHNSFVPDGIAAFNDHFGGSEAHRSPDYVQRPLRYVVDDDYAVVHVLLRKNVKDERDRGIVIMDIFRFEDGKIVEHWDVGMPVPDPATVPHNNGVY